MPFNESHEKTIEHLNQVLNETRDFDDIYLRYDSKKEIVIVYRKETNTQIGGINVALDSCMAMVVDVIHHLWDGSFKEFKK